MVAQLDESSMQYVVEGPDNRSRGLTSCMLIRTRRRGQDHDGQNAIVDVVDGRRMFIWDFQLLRADGSEVYLHPRYNNPKVGSNEGAPDADTSEDQPDGTSGQGRLKLFKKKHYQRELMFRRHGRYENNLKQPP